MSERRHFAVAAGVVVNGAGEVLIARRGEELHQGGLWEFPGGKIEPGETTERALVRELREELAIAVQGCEPLIRIHHGYPDRDVTLDVLRVYRFGGEPRAMLGQPLCWVAPERLPLFAFPAANRPIVTAARLPDRYAILDLTEPVDRPAVAERLAVLQRGGISLLRLRAKGVRGERYRALADWVQEWGGRRDMKVMLDFGEPWAADTGAAGVHLDAAALMEIQVRPVAADRYLAASCHDRSELEKAAALGVDFAVLSPVLSTPSHPGAKGMGWARFAELVEGAAFPVYALGGMMPEHRDLARRSGAQGIAGIRGIC